MPTVPDVGDTFAHRGSRYRVDGWLRPHPRPRSYMQSVGPDRVPLVFCEPGEAVYVSGYGVSGVIVRVADVVVDGRVNWSADQLADAHRHALRLAGQELV